MNMKKRDMRHGSRVVLRGGNANNGANAGAGYMNVNNGLANANVNIGGRLYALNPSPENPRPTQRSMAFGSAAFGSFGEDGCAKCGVIS